jgi:hypothetical protein
VAFADGSVKFIKDTVNSWSLVPNGQGSVMVPSSYYTLNFTSTGIVVTFNPGTPVGVWQALATKAGEIISAHQY